MVTQVGERSRQSSSDPREFKRGELMGAVMMICQVRQANLMREF